MACRASGARRRSSTPSRTQRGHVEHYVVPARKLLPAMASGQGPLAVTLPGIGQMIDDGFAVLGNGGVETDKRASPRVAISCAVPIKVYCLLVRIASGAAAKTRLRDRCDASQSKRRRADTPNTESLGKSGKVSLVASGYQAQYFFIAPGGTNLHDAQQRIGTIAPRVRNFP